MRQIKTILILTFIGLSFQAYCLPLSTPQDLSQMTGTWSFPYRLSRVSEDGGLQKFTNSAYLKIFKTQTGQWLCGFFYNDSQVIANFTGADLNTSKHIVNVCGSNLGKNADPRFDSLKLRKPLQLLLVNVNQSNFPLRSWSNYSDVTFLFYTNSETLTEENLIGRLSHELAIRLDVKDFFRYHTLLNKFEPQGYEQSLFQYSYRSKNFCGSLSLFSNKSLRQAFIAERAQKIEDSIRQEIYGSITNNQYTSCLGRLLNTLQNTVRAGLINTST